jgi:RNA-directed DNA polymerase
VVRGADVRAHTSGTRRGPQLHAIVTSARLTAARGLALAFLAGDWDPPAMTARGQRAVGERRVWVRDLALAARHAYPDPPRDRPRELAEFLAACAALRAVTVKRWYTAETAMGRSPWPVATLHTVGDLQDLLGFSPETLAWFADTRQLERTVPDKRLRHYRYRWVAKRSGGGRLIEEPKPVLKHVQQVLLREIVEHIPVHGAAHGFRKGRSALTHAGGHVQRQVVVRLDLEDFFTSVRGPRIYGLFRQCGYPEPVAHILTALTTNSVPRPVLAQAPEPVGSESTAGRRRLLSYLAQPHLPQGAPASPALANLAAFRLDRRLTGLAAATGLAYSRYADDLAFSSTRRRTGEETRRLVDLVTEIAAGEGFKVNELKTSVRRSGQRQRLAGVVINEHPNVDRRQYDLLKATVHNAARHGPRGQNRDGHPAFRDHLRGRIAWVSQLNPARGERLLATFSDIDWDR